MSTCVLQGSVLGPMLYASDMLLLGHLISTFEDISYHCYADDIRLHVSFKAGDLLKMSVLLSCKQFIK